MKFMDRLERLEQGIGQAVGFSKGFGTFEKADIANRIRTVMDDESYIDPNEMLMAPNIYAVNFSPQILTGYGSGATRLLLSSATSPFHTRERRDTRSLGRCASPSIPYRRFTPVISRWCPRLSTFPPRPLRVPCRCRHRSMTPHRARMGHPPTARCARRVHGRCRRASPSRRPHRRSNLRRLRPPLPRSRWYRILRLTGSPLS